MKITNNKNLPIAVYNAAVNDPYDRGHADISVTQLIDSPRRIALLDRHDAYLERDVSDSVFALIGTSLHTLMERGSKDEKNIKTEERFFITENSTVISGAVDRQVLNDNGKVVAIEDYKVTSVGQYMVKSKPRKFVVPLADADEWTRQLNCYAYLIYENLGYTVKKLEIIVFLRDWLKERSEVDDGYPPSPIVRVPIKKYSNTTIRRYVRDRVDLHNQASMTPDDDLIKCSNRERWQKPDVYAIHRVASGDSVSKKASRLAKTKAEANHIISISGSRSISIPRPGKRVRCEGYCEVSHLCNQHSDYEKTVASAEVSEKLVGLKQKIAILNKVIDDD